MRRRALLAGAVAFAAGAPRAQAPAPWSEALQHEARQILAGAAADGLDPADYRDGTVEASFGRYLRDLHLGRVRPRDLGFGVGTPLPDETFVAQALHEAIAAGRLAPAVERLTPAPTQYRRLREMLARYRAGDVVVADDKIAPARRLRQIELSMERLRWLPPLAGRPLVAINIPMFRLWAWDAGADADRAAPALAMDVIVGRAMRTQTPVFSHQMTHLVFRPYWNVPRSIVRNEILPAIERDPNYLARHDMEVVSGEGEAMRVRQRPGPKNSLGLVKFIFPNEASVYLHGTPSREMFSRSRRDFSHGCVRVADPPALAQWLLRDQPAWTREAIDAAMNGARTQQVNLGAPVPVLLYYLTAMVSPDDGQLRFADDIYRHDAALEKRLAARRR
ncbi:L,D-transpeptidase family protein [Piscinibacter sp.]|uniref:L,D-transpeptidase family protein n=1 Tax=Piscinibacter sp. TaxID=1903157 RepID=UPI0039E3EBCB